MFWLMEVSQNNAVLKFSPTSKRWEFCVSVNGWDREKIYQKERICSCVTVVSSAMTICTVISRSYSAEMQLGEWA